MFAILLLLESYTFVSFHGTKIVIISLRRAENGKSLLKKRFSRQADHDILPAPFRVNGQKNVKTYTFSVCLHPNLHQLIRFIYCRLTSIGVGMYVFSCKIPRVRARSNLISITLNCATIIQETSIQQMTVITFKNLFKMKGHSTTMKVSECLF